MCLADFFACNQVDPSQLAAAMDEVKLATDQTFTIFNNLPLELRRKIWRLGALEHRMISSCTHFNKRVPRIAIFHAYHEARTELLLEYTLVCGGDKDTAFVVHINPQNDAMYLKLLPSGQQQVLYYHDTQMFTYMHLQHLVLDVSGTRRWRQYIDLSFHAPPLDWLKEFTSLRKITLMLQESYSIENSTIRDMYATFFNNVEWGTAQMDIVMHRYTSIDGRIPNQGDLLPTQTLIGDIMVAIAKVRDNPKLKEILPHPKFTGTNLISSKHHIKFEVVLSFLFRMYTLAVDNPDWTVPAVEVKDLLMHKERAKRGQVAMF